MSLKDFLPLFGVIVGGLLAIFGGYISTRLVNKRHHDQQSRNIAYAIRGEIGALVDVFRDRKYLNGLETAIELMKSTNQVHPVKIHIRQDYTRVYNSNVGNIGILPGELSQEVASFYTRLFTVFDILKSYSDDVFSDRPPEFFIASYQGLHDQLSALLVKGEKVKSMVSQKYSD